MIWLRPVLWEYWARGEWEALKDGGRRRQTEGGGSMAGNGGRGRGKGFVRLTRAGRRSTPRSNTRRPSWRNTPFPGLLCNRSP